MKYYPLILMFIIVIAALVFIFTIVYYLYFYNFKTVLFPFLLSGSMARRCDNDAAYHFYCSPDRYH
jgi:hypothetical protein